MGALKKLFLTTLILAILPYGNAAALQAEPKPTQLETSPLIITGYQTYSGGVSFAQIYNNSSQLINLDNWFVQWKLESGSNTTNVKIGLKHWLPAGQYIIVAEDDSVAGADLEFSPNHQGNVKELKLVPPDQTYAEYITKGDMFTPFGRYEMEPTTAGNFTISRPFKLAEASSPLYGGGLYKVPDAPGLKIVEILATPRNCSPQDASSDPTCGDYIKLYNPTTVPIALDHYRLRLGWGNDSPGISNTFSLTGELKPGGYQTISQRDDSEPLNINASGGYVWLEDIYGIKKYGETAYQYPDLGGEDHRGFSWAANPETNAWQRAVPSPDLANNFTIIPMLSTENSSNLKPCAPGQERNSETNRCRNIASAASSLQPCKVGQERNPETNRCRSTATTATTLKPCGVGEERNPDTNRCRKVAAASTELPNVQDIQSTPDGRNYRWWVVGAVGAGAIAFGVWEWRRDIASWMSRLKRPGSPNA